MAYSTEGVQSGNSLATSDNFELTSLAFSASDLDGSRLITSTTCVSLYSVVSVHEICTIARCILIQRKYFGFRAMDMVALKVMVPLMLGMEAVRTNVLPSHAPEPFHDRL